MKSPELLAPAGTLRNLRYALAFGADAVYAGIPRYSLRVRNNEFNVLDNVAKGITEAHAAGRLFYLTVNLLPHNAKLRTFLDDIAPAVALGPDALIMADPGLIMLVRERWPELPIHLSVQANTMNWAAVKFWQSLGIERVILSREVSLDDIAEIRQRCPEMELEVFVHGALCIAYSGRCLLSGYFNHRDANQGSCTNACRWEYSVHSAGENASGEPVPLRHSEAEPVHFIEEGERPGELMPIEEDEHGTYILNSRDLRAVQHVQRLTEIGVESLKIEGRTKSHYYVARTTQVYRRAIDDAVAGRSFETGLLGELENLANRGYTEGFYNRHADAEYQNYRQASSDSVHQRFVAEVTAFDAETGMAQLDVKNKFAVGDRLELITPAGNHDFVLEKMESLGGEPMQEVPGGGWRVRIPLPRPADRFTLITRYEPA
ncbi:prephenate-dependent tRNA uridine(34) hydroxylase TrhP [Thiohalomonas denitrificans]|uniref:prephenate-dependent tRNA uridine(34) hydroxylase TrhP n=1 Tax=Thiohalomonas denitrificans TaxID=415747 RepID=UPI0026EB330E|nr:tRNA 5-hydroxyuridine modification protein YegQ [Thiohalomonas denitrificans]